MVPADSGTPSCRPPVWSPLDRLRSHGDTVGAVERAAAFFKLAGRHHESGRLEEALACYLTAAEIRPDLAEAHYNAGLVLQALGRASQAGDCYRRALEIYPDFAQAHNNLGQAHLQCGRREPALACFREALRLQPDFAEPHFNLGRALQESPQVAKAVAHYRSAVRLKPAMVEAWNNLGTVLKDLEDLPEAIECYRRVTALRPDLAEGYYNLGSALKDTGDYSGAVAALERALALRRDYPEAWNNLGLAHKGRGDYPRATECLTEAVRLKPDLAEAHWNRAFVYLMHGRFEEGFADYEWRFALPHRQMIYPFRHTLPRWNGRPDPACRVLVHDEQGLGDTLQFVRYLPYLKAVCGKVVLEAQPPLLKLLRDLPGVDELVARPNDGPSNVEADCHVPLMSLPGLFGTRVDSIPAVVPYLWADLAKAASWKQRLCGPAIKAGLVWAGRPQHQNDRNRSCRLEMFRDLTRIPGVRLVSLQKGAAVAQIRDTGFQDSIDDLDCELQDFSDTAAVIANLDLVITVDTSVAHLAGAMARPVWVLIPTIPDWRWLLARDDSPWYPSMRLFRQKQEGDWGAVVGRIETELRKLAVEGIVATAAGRSR